MAPGLDLGALVDSTCEARRLVRVQHRACSGSGRRSIDAANRYIQETNRSNWPRPTWTACRSRPDQPGRFAASDAILIKPFLPRTAETFYRSFNFEEMKAWDRIGYSDAIESIAGLSLRVTAPSTGGKPAPLFPKIETDPSRGR